MFFGDLGPHARFQNLRTTSTGRTAECPQICHSEGRRGVSEFKKMCILILLVTKGRMQNFRTLGQALLGE